MSIAPTLLPTRIENGSVGGVSYAVNGELVPTLHLTLDGSQAVYFEHHIVLWKSPDLSISLYPLKGAFRRMVAGAPIFMTMAQGPGEIAFSRDGVGHIFPIHLGHGAGIVVREHQYLAATDNVAFSFQRVKGASNMLLGGNGFFVDTFTSMNGEGIVFLHGYGNVFERTLAVGESIDVEPGGWVYREHSVTMTTTMYGLKTGILGGGGNLIFNRFTGPGRVGIQSMYYHLPTSQ